MRKNGIHNFYTIQDVSACPCVKPRRLNMVNCCSFTLRNRSRPIGSHLVCKCKHLCEESDNGRDPKPCTPCDLCTPCDNPCDNPSLNPHDFPPNITTPPPSL